VIVVADAGSLIHLASIGQLDLLRRLADEVLVPRAVFHEVTVVGAGLPGAESVRAATWARVVTPARTEVVDALLAAGLDRGESEAIVSGNTPQGADAPRRPRGGMRPRAGICGEALKQIWLARCLRCGQKCDT
jgi:hypothetical protein